MEGNGVQLVKIRLSEFPSSVQFLSIFHKNHPSYMDNIYKRNPEGASEVKAHCRLFRYSDGELPVSLRKAFEKYCPSSA